MNTDCQECGALYDYQPGPQHDLCPTCQLKALFKTAAHALCDVQCAAWDQGHGPIVNLMLEKSLSRLKEAQKLIGEQHHAKHR